MDYRKKYLKYKKKYLTTKKLIVNKVLDKLQKKNTNSKNKLLGGMDTGSIIGIITAIISVLGVGWYSMSEDKYKMNRKAEHWGDEYKGSLQDGKEGENTVFGFNGNGETITHGEETTHGVAVDYEEQSLGG